MKLTKYPQSCLILCKNGQCLCIDPGTLVTAKYKLADLGLIEAVLYTHEHADHFDPAIIQELVDSGVEIYANADVAAKITAEVTIVKDKEELVIAGFNVTAYDLPHCKMSDGSDGPPNTGFLIDGMLFHPGDGIELTGLRAENLALPIAGPSINFDNAIAFADQIEAVKIIPIHYDGHYKAYPEEFTAKAGPDRVIVLKDGESTELT